MTCRTMTPGEKKRQNQKIWEGMKRIIFNGRHTHHIQLHTQPTRSVALAGGSRQGTPAKSGRTKDVCLFGKLFVTGCCVHVMCTSTCSIAFHETETGRIFSAEKLTVPAEHLHNLPH